MARIVVIGGGIVGLATSMLLAKDGHEVVALERDAASPAPSPDAAWTGWERRGVNQFRLPHFLLARFRKVVDAELPEVAAQLAELGALRANVVEQIPDSFRGPLVAGDDDFEIVTARRPVAELAVARAASGIDGLEVRRGVTAAALVVDGGTAGVPKV